MKNKLRIVACCLAAMLLCSLAGCQLALKDKGTAAGEDRLVGVFVTTESLNHFDIQSDLTDNLNVNMNGEVTLDDIAQQDQGRLYATLTKKAETDEETGETTGTDEYVFDGVKGVSFFCPLVPATAGHESYIDTVSDDAISDGKTGVSSDGKGYSLTLEGTIYVLPSSTERLYYLNPVYQSADGRVYVTGNMGCALEGYDETKQSTMASQDGDEVGQSLNATYTTTENGKATSHSTSVKITFHVVNPPTSIAVLQMDANSAVVSRMEYTPGKLPKAITPEPNTEYIVLEATKTDSDGNVQIIRTLYGKDAETLDTFNCRADGVFVKQPVQVKWPQ